MHRGKRFVWDNFQHWFVLKRKERERVRERCVCAREWESVLTAATCCIIQAAWCETKARDCEDIHFSLSLSFSSVSSSFTSCWFLLISIFLLRAIMSNISSYSATIIVPMKNWTLYIDFVFSLGVDFFSRLLFAQKKRLKLGEPQKPSPLVKVTLCALNWLSKITHREFRLIIIKEGLVFVFCHQRG